jgi:predicted aspartyl protease
VTIVKARVSLHGFRDTYSCVTLVDTGARMTLIDNVLAERIGVEYTGRVLNLISISEQVLRALEAVVPMLGVEDEELKYEAVAVISIPEDVKRVLRQSGLDENIVIGLLTLERAGMVPDTVTGTLRKVEMLML